MEMITVLYTLLVIHRATNLTGLMGSLSESSSVVTGFGSEAACRQAATTVTAREATRDTQDSDTATFCFEVRDTTHGDGGK